MPKVSVILLNYNSTTYTIQCIESIEQKTQIISDYELIVVDNNSKIEELYSLERYIEGRSFNHPLHFIKNNKNLGFSGGNQKGADRADGEYLFFLNNDCVFKNDVVSILYKFMKNSCNVGLCTAKMLDENDSLLDSFVYLPSIGLMLLGIGFLRIFNKKKYLSKKVAYSIPQKVEVVTGAAIFIKKDTFTDIGGFDLSYFFYWEEHDLAIRLKKKKLDVYYVPEGEYIHYQGKSTGKSYEVKREFYISLFIFFRKHFSFFERIFFRLFYLQKFGLKPFRKHFFRLFLFVLRGAPENESLRYKI